MLTDINISETLEISFAGSIPFTPVEFDLPIDTFYQVAWIRSTWTTLAAIGIPGFTIRDETGAIINITGLIPWQFAATTIERVNVQSPEVNQTNLFGPAIAGYISSGLTVQRGWTYELTDFLGTVGVTMFGTIGLTRVTEDG